MHVCFLCTEIFRWGKHGGFGRATRVIGRELARRGVRVSAVVPLPRGATEPVTERFDGITVHGYPPTAIGLSRSLCRDLDADVYHTEEPFLGTFVARRAAPRRAHVVTFRDPRVVGDWWTEFRHPTRSRRQVATTCLYYENPLVRWAVRRADGWGAAAAFLIPKARAKYGLARDPVFLPAPVRVPDRVEKAGRPTVCFVGRLDRVKRPDVFFDLARRHPEARFIAAGASQDDSYAAELLHRYSGLPNLELTGFVDQFASDALSRIFAESWVLVNTSAKEALPNAFIEAAGHRCAILSPFDPDGFATRSGCRVRDGDFAAGLAWLFEGDSWRALGEAGARHAKEFFDTDAVIDRHLAFYDAALAARAARL